jgi:hypothetical protein
MGILVFTLLFFSALAFYLLVPKPLDRTDLRSVSRFKDIATPLFPYDAIGSGGLTLNPRPALGWICRIADELFLIAYNSRPDVSERHSNILLSLKQGKDPVEILNGKTLYLKESQEGRGLDVSYEATSLWVKPILLDNGSILVEAGRRLKSQDGLEGEEKGQFILNRKGAIPAMYSPVSSDFVSEIKDARLFGQDLFMQKYGGNEFSFFAQKSKLELSHPAGTYALFISAGDYLIYKEGEWQVAPLEEVSPEYAVAKIKSLSPRAAEIECWDRMGYHAQHIKLEMEKPARFHLKPDTLPSSIRLRSSSQVSCSFGKKRVILKQGDWLLKTKSGWRNLRRREEIEQCLQHRIKGELFIFDSIEKDQGKLMMKGHCFDESRTQVQPFSLPVDAEKNQIKTTRGKRTSPSFAAASLMDRRVA